MRLFAFWLMAHWSVGAYAFQCREIFASTETRYVERSHFRECLNEINGEVLPENISRNFWRLLKTTFNGIENVPVEIFADLGYILQSIAMDDLRNVSMERAEIVEAFGAIGKMPELPNFSKDQMELIVQKIETEWLGKNATTYSEYDLIAMSGILCHFNVQIIERIHADAFRNAVEWFGSVKNCPHEGREALAKLAKHHDAFGRPSGWSKLTISLMGDLINGLPKTDLAAIDEEKLVLNRYWAELHKDKQNKIKAQTNATNYGDETLMNETTSENSTAEKIES